MVRKKAGKPRSRKRSVEPLTLQRRPNPPVGLFDWELAVRDMPGGPVPGSQIGIVVEPSTSVLRLMIPIIYGAPTVSEVAAMAMESPEGGLHPARPRAFIVEDETHAQAISRDIGVPTRQGALPACDRVLGDFTSFSADRGEAGECLSGVALREDRAVARAGSFARREPWRYLFPASPITMRWEDGTTRIALVLCGLEEILGLVVFDREEDWGTWADSVAGQETSDVLDLMPNARVVFFTPANEVADDVRAYFRDRDLPIVHGLYPTFVRTRTRWPGPQALTDDAEIEEFERIMDVLGAFFDEHADAIVETDDSIHGAHVDADGRRVDVTLEGREAEPDEAPFESPDPTLLPELQNAEHSVGIVSLSPAFCEAAAEVCGVSLALSGEDLTAVVIRARKADALRVGRALERMDALELRNVDAQVAEVRATSGAELIGVLGRLPLQDRETLGRLLPAGRKSAPGLVLVLKGGTRRGSTNFLSSDAVACRPVNIRRR